MPDAGAETSHRSNVIGPRGRAWYNPRTQPALNFSTARRCNFRLRFTQVQSNRTVHRPPERLICLYAAIEEPAPGTRLLDLSVRRLSFPRHVPPEDRLVKRKRLPDGPGVDSIVEEDYESAPPVPTNRKRLIPPSGSSHLVRREIEGIDLGLRQIVPPSNVTLRLQFRKPRKSVDQILCSASSQVRHSAS